MTTRREFLTQALGATIAAATGHAIGAQRARGIVQTVQGPIDAAKLGGIHANVARVLRRSREVHR
jgi:hypothetical protein